MKFRLALGLAVAALAAGCTGQEMDDQAKIETFEAGALWKDGQSARLPVPGTVARGESLAPRPDRIPAPVTMEMLRSGRERFDIYCAPCHGRLGDGHGMIVERGFPRPPTYHSARLRGAPDSHFFDVITNGYGAMYPYAARVEPEERWAIVAYIRVLQLSQHAPAALMTGQEPAGGEPGGRP